MEAILYLAHRIPYPPEKGDKVRSFHWLKHLSARFRVFLGAFVDDPDDWRYSKPLRELCDDVCLRPLTPLRKGARSVLGLLGGRSLSVAVFADRALREWVADKVRQESITRGLAFSSVMAQYLTGGTFPGLRWVADFVDVDSVKWRQYAERRRWPTASVYSRESRELLRFEREVAAESRNVVFVTEQERELFRGLAPESAERLQCVENGVDSAFFSPDGIYANPYGAERALVFTGAMDYWANVDAVTWFAASVLPAVRARMPDVSFWIVGARPAAEVMRLARLGGVRVTGRVPDTRPYLAHAAAIVAPLRIARGVQNKVLEGMAMGKPVVATHAAMEGIRCPAELMRWVADDAAGLAERCVALLEDGGAAAGRLAREVVRNDYRWEERAARIEELIAG